MADTLRALFLLIPVALVPSLQAAADGSSLKELDIEEIHVIGTRIPAAGIIKVSGLQIHAKVNDLDIVSACHEITATGLVQNVKYAYDSYPDRPGVTLNLSVADEKPLVPASIALASEEAAMWAALETANPIFTRSLPPTEKALALYENAINNYLHANGRPDNYAKANVKRDPQGHPTAAIFEIHKYRSIR